MLLQVASGFRDAQGAAAACWCFCRAGLGVAQGVVGGRCWGSFCWRALLQGEGRVLLQAETQHGAAAVPGVLEWVSLVRWLTTHSCYLGSMLV